ncbi:hypothetical protein FGG08_002516 [Glutinoglossum americanum]|uniref:Ankyrin repeat protein n=1 Tax=Glutinoglossum americanum TaxID=1670608 RepID=A0A9P8I667_9PEZI|nr:hypothetical protein FGG08_002516 [Glutinoglossum americanum]
MAELAASAIALGGVALGIYEKVQGFLGRARVSDRFAQDLLNELQQARKLIGNVQVLAERCGARRSSAPNSPDSQPESDSWSNVLEALEYSKRCLNTLDHELEALSSTSGATLLERAWGQWKIDGRNELIEKTKSELQSQMVKVNLSLNCIIICLSTDIFERLLPCGSFPVQPPCDNGDQPLSPCTPNSISPTITLVESTPSPTARTTPQPPAQISPILISAVKKKDTSLVQDLVDGGVDLEARDSSGWTPLHHAAHYGNRAILGILLSEKSDVNAPDNAGLTPLHIAAMQGKESVGGLLIKSGATIDARDLSSESRTPLVIAVAKGKEPFVGMLLRHGANPDSGRHAKKFADIVASLRWQGKLYWDEG